MNEDYPRCKKCGDYIHPNFPCEEAKALREPDTDYDVVIDVLTKHRNKLWEMTERNMRSISINIMDQIRLEQISEIDEAIHVWKTYNLANTNGTEDE